MSKFKPGTVQKNSRASILGDGERIVPPIFGMGGRISDYPPPHFFICLTKFYFFIIQKLDFRIPAVLLIDLHYELYSTEAGCIKK